MPVVETDAVSLTLFDEAMSDLLSFDPSGDTAYYTLLYLDI